MIESLDKILSGLRINTALDFEKYLAGYPKDSSLKLINKNTAKAFFEHYYDHEEGRIYKEKIELKGCIIDLPNLNLRDSSEIQFIDCIFTGNIVLGAHDAKDILIDCCIFLKDLAIGMAGKKEDITIYKSNISFLHLHGLEASSFYMTNSRIDNFEIEECSIKSFRATDNKISYFRFSSSSIKDSFFPHSQIDFNSFIGIGRIRYFANKACEYYRKKLQKKTINLFTFLKSDVDEFITNITYKKEKETLSFLLNNSDIKNNRNHFSDIILNSSIYEQNSILSKILIYLVGAFSKPRILFLHAIFIYLLFAFIYTLPFSEFIISGNLTTITTLNSFYYSGIVFTTIGDSSISPVGVTKILTIIESGIGIFLASSFLVSLIRKYCD